MCKYFLKYFYLQLIVEILTFELKYTEEYLKDKNIYLVF